MPDWMRWGLARGVGRCCDSFDTLEGANSLRPLTRRNVYCNLLLAGLVVATWTRIQGCNSRDDRDRCDDPVLGFRRKVPNTGMASRSLGDQKLDFQTPIE